MKKLLSIILIILVLTASVLCLFSCEDNSAKEDEQSAANTETAAETEEETSAETEEASLGEAPQITKTVVFSDGHSVTLGDAADTVSASCGEATDVIEAPSCINEGTDRVYSFNGYSVTTSPDESGSDYVASVELTAPEAVLENGISVGSAVSDAIAAFGDGYTESFGLYTYELDGFTVTFVAESDALISLAYALNID